MVTSLAMYIALLKKHKLCCRLIILHGPLALADIFAGGGGKLKKTLFPPPSPGEKGAKMPPVPPHGERISHQQKNVAKMSSHGEKLGKGPPYSKNKWMLSEVYAYSYNSSFSV